MFRCLCLCTVLLLSLPAMAQQRPWFTVSTPHFLLFTDTSAEKAERLAADLEARVAAFDAAFGPLMPRQFPIEVFLLDRDEDFVAAFPPGGDGEDLRKSAFLVEGPDRWFLVTRDDDPDDIADDAGHALGHVLVERQLLWRPFWLAEGAAEFVRRIGRNPETRKVSEEDGYTVADLLTIVPSADYDDGDESTFRLQSFRLLQLLMRDHPEALRQYFDAVQTLDGRDASLDVDVGALQSAFAAFTEYPIALPKAAPASRAVPADAATVTLHQGDLMLAAERLSEASRYFNGSEPEARAARAILSRFARLGGEAYRLLSGAAAELPDHGLVQYHFGALERTDKAELELQAAALERSITLLPRFGRAYGELARVSILLGDTDRAEWALEQAMTLSPEYADRFYGIQVELQIARQDWDGAYRAMDMAEALPHRGRERQESFMTRMLETRRRIESARREVDAEKLEALRREVEELVAEREPPPEPEPEIRIPQGTINYAIQARTQLEVIHTVFPEYTEALRRDGVAGRVVVRLSLNGDGTVKSATVLQSQAPVLNDAVVDAARQWRFRLPRPVSTTVQLGFDFVLR